MHACIVPPQALSKNARRVLHLRRHLTQMVEAVAKSHLKLRQLLEIVADDVLVRHANPPCNCTASCPTWRMERPIWYLARLMARLRSEGLSLSLNVA